MNKTPYLTLAALLGLTACPAGRISLLPPYRFKVVQGSELDPHAVISLQPGMTHDQIILLPGTPLLRDPFHAGRWDYTFNTSRNGVIEEQVDLVLHFENGLFARAEGNAVQKAIEVVQTEQRSASGGQAAAPLKQTGYRENM